MENNRIIIKKVFLFLLIQLIVLLPIKASADYQQGNAIWLLHVCEIAINISHNPAYGLLSQGEYAGECVGYMTATLGIYYSAAYATNQFSICAPGNATNEQYARIIVKYLKNHPEILNQAGYLPILKALQQAWPCTPQGKTK
jgi:hypothetical protein